MSVELQERPKNVRWTNAFFKGGLEESTFQARVIACTKALRPKGSWGLLSRREWSDWEGRWGWVGPSLLAWSCQFSQEAPGRLNVVIIAELSVPIPTAYRLQFTFKIYFLGTSQCSAQTLCSCVCNKTPRGSMNLLSNSSLFYRPVMGNRAPISFPGLRCLLPPK